MGIPRAFLSTDVAEDGMKLFENFLPLTLLIFLFHDNQKDPSTGLPPPPHPQNEACIILSDTKTKSHN